MDGDGQWTENVGEQSELTLRVRGFSSSPVNLRSKKEHIERGKDDGGIHSTVAIRLVIILDERCI